MISRDASRASARSSCLRVRRGRRARALAHGSERARGCSVGLPLVALTAAMGLGLQVARADSAPASIGHEVASSDARACHLTVEGGEVRNQCAAGTQAVWRAVLATHTAGPKNVEVTVAEDVLPSTGMVQETVRCFAEARAPGSASGRQSSSTTTIAKGELGGTLQPRAVSRLYRLIGLELRAGEELAVQCVVPSGTRLIAVAWEG